MSLFENEEIQLAPYQKVEQMRKHYLGHLHDVVMVDAEMMTAERLGGADYDGDMIKTIADPIVNDCVKRNYLFGDFNNSSNFPLLVFSPYGIPFLPASDRSAMPPLTAVLSLTTKIPLRRNANAAAKKQRCWQF